jgi:putative Mg2+ transporter-C (MgtC) family protein
MNTSIDQAAISLGAATLFGACIGFERQWRQRMAGLRTNTLVAIGAASFVVFAGLFPDGDSPTRVAAQVVSGIGFLGAGIIFREGLHVTGLNTAATLWCSAAVGLLAGSGHPLHAALATGFVVLVNLTLRPLVRIINRQPIMQAETDFHYRIRVVCRNPEEAHVRALLLQCTGNSQLSLRQLDSTDLEESGRVEVSSRRIRRTTPFLNRSSAASVSNQPFQPPAGASHRCWNSHRQRGMASTANESQQHLGMNVTVVDLT